MEARKKKLFDIYGVSIYNMMPEGYRSWDKHANPSKAFVYVLAALSNINRKDSKLPLSLAELQLALIAAANARRWGVIGANTDRHIILTDLQYAYRLRLSLKRRSTNPQDESDKEACLKNEVSRRPMLDRCRCLPNQKADIDL